MRFAVGIEDTFVPQSSPGRRPLDEYALTGHYERWRDDVALAAASGAGMIRYGLPWHRCNPAPGRFDWSWADKVVDELLGAGLEPILDLVHYGCPLWLDGAFDHADYPGVVADWAAAVAERYGDRVQWYTPLNEPLITALLCGGEGRWPPELQGEAGFVRVALQVARGIAGAQEAVRAAVPEAVLCHVEASFRHDPRGAVAGDLAFLDERRWLVGDLLTGRVGTAHPLHGWLRRSGATDGELEEFARPRAVPDVVGVNYYPHLTTRRLAGRALGACVAGWTDELVELLRLFAARYGRPVFVTETSVVGPVEERLRWLRASVAAVRALHADGVDVVGYTWWPLFTLVDWDYREGSKPPVAYHRHMGLVDLDGGGDRHETALLAAFRALSA